MNDKIKSKIEQMISEEHPLIVLNRTLGRDPKIITDQDIVHTGWPDTTAADIPSYLVQVLNAQYRTDDITKTKDLVVQAILSNPSLQITLAGIVRDYNQYLADIVASSGSDGNVFDFEVCLAKACISEMSKMQVLVNAPIFGHNLAAGGHPIFLSPPGGYDITDSFSIACGNLFRSICAERKYDFTVPALSSQGMTLKTLRDTPQWRIWSKAIMATLAQRTKTRAQYDNIITRLDAPFTDRGFSGVANDFYLGMRRQGMRKVEPVSSMGDVDGSMDYDLGCTSAIQGRVRGIFPPSEYTKHYFKPFAEAIKKALFNDFFSTAVDLNFISLKVHLLAALSAKENLFDDSGDCMAFYDLSAMDTTTHEGFQDSYHAFCRGVFPDFESIEGDTFKSCRLFFPNYVGSSVYYVQNVGGRSTLSGQPDVTTKNNICHLLAMAWCLGKTFEVEPLEAFEHLMTGKGTLKGQRIIAHIHGDDTMIYMGSDKAKYSLYYEYLAELGFKTSFEHAPIFLKKTVRWKKINTDSGFISNVISDCLEALDRFHVGFKDDESLISDFNDLCFEFANYDNAFNRDCYNAKFVGSLYPVPGSLFKNRFGEYPTTEAVLGILGLSDTILLLGEMADDNIRKFWSLLLNVFINKLTPEQRDDLGFPEIKDISDYSNDHLDSITSLEFRTKILSYVLEMASASVTKAQSIRHALERLFYSGGEIINDQTLETVFGSLFLTPQLLEESFDLSLFGIDELVELYVKLQNTIIDSNGNPPSMEDSLMKQANAIIKNIGKI